MGSSVYLLPHQERFLQSPYNFTKIRWHFLLGGYGAGKTISLVFIALYLVSLLQNIKDKAGKYARIMIGGYTYAHLEQTFMIDFLAYLDASKTPYRNDTKNHIMYIGTVEIIFVQLSEPDRIFGQSVYACFVDSTKVLTRRGGANILEVSISDVNEGDEVLTRKGWKKVLRVNDNGYRECMAAGKSLCTPDHKFATGTDWTEAQNLSPETLVWKYDLKGVKLCQKLENGASRYLQMLRNLTESDITDTRILRQAVNETITGVKTIKRIMSHCGKNTTGVYLKDVASTILTVILSTMTSVISSVSQYLNITACTLNCSETKEYSELTSTEKSVLKSVKRLLKDVRKIEYALYAERLSEDYLLLSSALLRAEIKHTERHRSDIRLPVSIVEKSSQPLSSVQGIVAKNIMMLECIDWAKLLITCLKQEPVSYVERHLSALSRVRHKLAHLTARTSREGRRYHVYDLTVEDCHEYFADGALVHNCLLDEVDELPEDTMIEAMKSVSQRCRQKLPGQRSCFIMSASTAQGYKGFYRLYTHYKKAHIAFVLTRAWTEDNIYLPPEYIEDLKKSFTPTELEVFMHGEFLSVAQGRVIPGFDWKRNFVNETIYNLLAPGTRVFIGMDFNSSYNRASAWVSLPDKNGVYRMCCVKYYDFPDPLEAPNVFRYDFPEQDLFWIPDVTSKDSFPQFAKALRQNNVHIIYRKKSPLVEDSCFFISSMCYQGRAVIYEDAATVAEAFAQASRDKNNKIPKGVGPSSPIHAIDGARYATSYMGLVLPEYRDVRRSLMSHIATYRSIIEDGDAEEQNVRDLGSGYTQIEGQAYLE